MAIHGQQNKVFKAQLTLDWFIDKLNKYKANSIFLFGIHDKVWESLSFIIDYQCKESRHINNKSEKINAFKKYAFNYINNDQLAKVDPWIYYPISSSLRYTIKCINAFVKLHDTSLAYFNSNTNSKIDQIKYYTGNIGYVSANKKIAIKVKKNRDTIDENLILLNKIDNNEFSKEDSLIKLDEIAMTFNGIPIYCLVEEFGNVLISKEPCLQ